MPSKPIKYKFGDPDNYNPITLSRESEDDLRAEYKKLRRNARERLQRIERSEDFGDSPIVRNNKSWLDIKPADIPAKELPSMLSQLESLLEAKTGTLSGLRRQRALSIESLKDRGIKGINKKNYGDYIRFMNATQLFREAYIPYPKRSKGSEIRDAAREIRPKLFLLKENANVSQRSIQTEFQFFRDHLDEIENLVKQKRLDPSRKRSYSANEIRKMLGMNPEPIKTLKEAREAARSLVPERTKKGRGRK